MSDSFRNALYGVTTPFFNALYGKRSVTIKKPQNEFSGQEPELALGYLMGTRAFDVDSLGRLRGVSFDHIWTPGVNEAECLKGNYRSKNKNGYPIFLGVLDSHDPEKVWSFFVKACEGNDLPFGMNEAIKAYKDEKKRIVKEDSIATCTHGFYGYYEGSNDYYEPGRVNGVIKAYGEVVVGTRGFRSTKAEIVALQIPDSVSEREANLIRRNYPNVQFFFDFEAMVAEFPPDSTFTPSPSTHADFWTMEA